jgi:hypothetical protein
MREHTALWASSGWILGSIGVCLRMYMTIRTKGLSGFADRKSGVPDEYRKLAQHGVVPKWPSTLSVLFIALGVLVEIVSVLSSR